MQLRNVLKINVVFDTEQMFCNQRTILLQSFYIVPCIGKIANCKFTPLIGAQVYSLVVVYLCNSSLVH